MRKKAFILLSGIMIGSTLFAVPGEEKDEKNPDMFANMDPDTLHSIIHDMTGWSAAKLNAEVNGGSEKKYYDRMEERAFQCMDIEDRCNEIAKFAKSAVFPLKTDVSKDFLSLLSCYLPDGCFLHAKEWREAIVGYVWGFRLGKMKNAEKIENDLLDLTDGEKDGAVTFDGANSMIMVYLILYELERLAGIVQ